jgi:hypothetical protein
MGVVPASAQRSTPTQRLRQLGITLPPLAPAIGTYVPAVKVGNLLFVSGHGPALLPDGTRTVGKVGRDVTLADAQAAARRVGLSALPLHVVARSDRRCGRLCPYAGHALTPRYAQRVNFKVTAFARSPQQFESTGIVNAVFARPIPLVA